MFSSVSMTGVGLVVVLAETVLKVFGVELPEGTVLKLANDVVSAVAGVMVVYGQFRRKDLKFGFLRR